MATFCQPQAFKHNLAQTEIKDWLCPIMIDFYRIINKV